MKLYLKDWLEIIEGMANDNTYKLAWGRSIIECVLTQSYREEKENIYLSFSALSENILKYYWNQTFFFNLKQGPNKEKPPIILQITQEVIEKYKTQTNSNIPVWYDQARSVLFNDESYYQSIIKKLNKAISLDVCWRFLNVSTKTYDIYKLDKSEKWISFHKDNLKVLEEYGFVLTQLLNYKWAQLLEKFNKAPQITNKVNSSQNNEIKRKNLSKFKDILLEEFPDKQPIDFYTGKVLKENDISIDHVIPWSFIYSDDLWNLVITSKSYNSSKSNSVPSLDVINKLKDRNRVLVDKVNNDNLKNNLRQSLEYNYIMRYYLDLKG